MLRAKRCADDAEQNRDRAKRYLAFANWIAPADAPVRASRRVYFLAIAVTVLAALVIWDASAGAALPGGAQSMKAGAIW